MKACNYCGEPHRGWEKCPRELAGIVVNAPISQTVERKVNVQRLTGASCDLCARKDQRIAELERDNASILQELANVDKRVDKVAARVDKASTDADASTVRRQQQREWARKTRAAKKAKA